MSRKIIPKLTNSGLLVLIRHGESRFNELNLFTGCVDVPLTEKGVKEADQVASHCQQFNYDAAFTSHLERAHETLLLILSRQQKIGIFQHNNDGRYEMTKKTPALFRKQILPINSSKALNERAYGALQGMNKDKATELYGASQILKWRRGFSSKPPQGESLKDVYKRSVRYFNKMIIPRLKRRETNLIVSHGNTLRAIIKYIENIEDVKIPLINLPFASPLVYEYKNNRFSRIEGTYNFERVLR